MNYYWHKSLEFETCPVFIDTVQILKPVPSLLTYWVQILEHVLSIFPIGICDLPVSCIESNMNTSEYIECCASVLQGGAVLKCFIRLTYSPLWGQCLIKRIKKKLNLELCDRAHDEGIPGRCEKWLRKHLSKQINIFILDRLCHESLAISLKLLMKELDYL